MYRGLRWRTILAVIAVLVAVWQLYPTLRLMSLSPEEQRAMDPDALAKLRKRAVHLGLDLQGGMHLVLEVDKSGLPPEEARDATDRALEIIRNRIDQFGVYEPTIQKQGTERIVVQLPGVLDRERAKSLIGSTALLEFRLVEEQARLSELLTRIDDALYEESKAQPGVDTLELETRPLSSKLVPVRRVRQYGIPPAHWPEVEALLTSEAAQKVIPHDVEFLPGEVEKEEEFEFRPLYLVKAKPELTGAAIIDARPNISPGQSGLPETRVNLTMHRRAWSKWAAVTGGNVGRQIAIVLDGVVRSAPVVRDRIPRGESVIQMGNSPMSEATDLAIVLRAGALPAPVEVIEERSVGPSLGRDSIQNGIRSAIIGGAVVLLFMLIYYSASGLLSGFALILNLIFLLALLSGVGATLTLPGIAGVVLTVGIAVDANVLIFERIREELKAGKTTRSAIDTGYTRAFRTILDANVTTLLAAIILAGFGTGPIRGFATTLSLGIICSFFTAIFITRLIFDLITTRWEIRRLRI
jgi:SecD/SecF fusion protein